MFRNNGVIKNEGRGSGILKKKSPKCCQINFKTSHKTSGRSDDKNLAGKRLRGGLLDPSPD